MAHARLTSAREEQRAAGTIADIAYRCGFASQSHFTRVFREQFGHTPCEVRTRPIG